MTDRKLIKHDISVYRMVAEKEDQWPLMREMCEDVLSLFAEVDCLTTENAKLREALEHVCHMTKRQSFWEIQEYARRALGGKP
jgi:hypothetical protein